MSSQADHCDSGAKGIVTMPENCPMVAVHQATVRGRRYRKRSLVTGRENDTPFAQIAFKANPKVQVMVALKQKTNRYVITDSSH